VGKPCVITEKKGETRKIQSLYANKYKKDYHKSDQSERSKTAVIVINMDALSTPHIFHRQSLIDDRW